MNGVGANKVCQPAISYLTANMPFYILGDSFMR